MTEMEVKNPAVTMKVGHRYTMLLQMVTIMYIIVNVEENVY